MTKFPIELQFYLIDALCEVFYWKKPLRHFMSSMQIPRNLYELFLASLRIETKRVALEQLFEGLTNTPNNIGDDVFSRITSTLISWKNLSASSDKVSAKNAIEELRKAYEEYILIGAEQNTSNHSSFSGSRESQEKLLQRYYELVKSDNPQSRGLLFEKLLIDIFGFEEIEAEGAFKLDGEQIDGAFLLKDIHYLLEAKWQKNSVAPKDIAWFKQKIDRKMSGTRGLFISINGFTDGAVRTANESRLVILMDGDDLHYVLSLTSDINLRHLLNHKIAVFSKYGNAFATARDLENN